MSRPRLLLAHSREMFENYFGVERLADLEAIAEVVRNPHDRAFTAEELIAAAGGCAIVVSDRQTPGPAKVFEALPDLVAFQRVAVDIRTIDVDAASAAGVLVTRATPGFVPAVVEWILGAMIAAARRLPQHFAAYARGEEPTSLMGAQLSGATLGIVGFGAIGSRLAEVAQALGMKVLVCDPYKPTVEPFRAVDLATLLGESDYVAPLAVATEETEKLVDAAALSKMKPTAWLINASRGDLVDEQALEAALDSKKIAGAAMDVGRAPDQRPSLRLARRPDVIATPHVGGLTPQAISHQALDVVEQARRIVRGEIPTGAVNGDRATRIVRLR